MVKLGIVCFANDGGLGAQTRRLTYMLKPFRILVIDSSKFSKNKKQNWHWYDQFQGYKVDGFPTNFEINKFLKDLTHVLVCENPLNFYLFSQARALGIKTYCQSNYEFCDNLNNATLPLPDKFLMPSYWKVKEMEERFGRDRVMHLPPPLDMNEFKEARDINWNRTGKLKLLHIVGTLASHDRNGTLSLLDSLKYTDSDFELIVKSQHDLPDNYKIADHRVKYVIENEPNNANLYKDFDAVILPRRYGGLSLVTNEALASGLPVIMPDISPNNSVLPKSWLIPAKSIDSFMARVKIYVHSVDSKMLAEKIDTLAHMSEKELADMKIQAFEIAHTNFSDTNLSPIYENLWLQ